MTFVFQLISKIQPHLVFFSFGPDQSLLSDVKRLDIFGGRLLTDFLENIGGRQQCWRVRH